MSRRADIRYADLNEFNDSVLLRTFASLTHQIHEADREKGDRKPAFDLRARRDLVEQEILRRMATPSFTLEDAVQRGIALIERNRAHIVRDALRQIGMKKVSDLTQQQQIREFMRLTS